MDVFEAFEKRHSYRGPFTDDPVSRQALQTIVEAGLKAPSGCNEQTTGFVIVDDDNILKQIRTMHQRNTSMQQCRALVVCFIDVNPEAVYEGYAFQVEDCAAAVENMLLATTALGLATVWIDGWLRVDDHAKKIADLLGIPDTKIVRIVLPVGVPAEKHQQPEKMLFGQRAWFNKYQG